MTLPPESDTLRKSVQRPGGENLLAGEGRIGETGEEGALVLATSPAALQVVGGLPLAVRVVMALREAGVAEIAVWPGGSPTGLRAELNRRGAPVRWLADPLDGTSLAPLEAVLLLPGDVLVDPVGLRRAARCPGQGLPQLLAALAAGRSLADALKQLDGEATARSGDGLFLPLDAMHPPAVLERALLDHLAGRTTAGDSYLAALVDRRLSRPVTRLLLGCPISPSQITLASIVVGLAGAAGLATVSYWGRLAGVLGLIASIVLDCVDGEVARARFEQSATGARLDVIGDYLVNLGTFTALAIGLARQGLPPAGTWAAWILVGGVAAAMGTMHALFVRPALTRGGDLHWEGDAQSLHGMRAAGVVEKLASRDYTYLLLGLALIGHLEWFFYAAAGGSWVFAAGLIGYWVVTRPTRRRQVASR